MKIEDIQLEERMFALFKGDPGAGKSIAAASYPKPYFFDVDGRMKSVRNFWVPRGKTDIEYDRYDSPFDIQKRLNEFYIDCPFKTLVLDGITTTTRTILNDAKVFRGVDEEGKKGKANRRMVGRIELTQIEDYDAEATWIEAIIGNLKAISFRHNINVIVTAHILTTEATDIKTKVTTTSRVILTKGKKAAAAIPVDFDEAYHFDVQASFDSAGPRYTVVTRNTGWDWAKTALPIDTRLDFTNASLYDKILESMKKNQDAQAMSLSF